MICRYINSQNRTDCDRSQADPPQLWSVGVTHTVQQLSPFCHSLTHPTTPRPLTQHPRNGNSPRSATSLSHRSKARRQVSVRRLRQENPGFTSAKPLSHHGTRSLQTTITRPPNTQQHRSWTPNLTHTVISPWQGDCLPYIRIETATRDIDMARSLLVCDYQRLASPAIHVHSDPNGS